MTDGSSDKVLTVILTWVIRELLPNASIQSKFADLRKLSNPPRSLEDRMLSALKGYPCEILFIHRDSENQPLDKRKNEIMEAWNKVRKPNQKNSVVAVIPVRMSETWLLCDAEAIKAASGNPNGRVNLKMPSIKRLEDESNPKKLFHSLIQRASELKGRNLTKLNVHRSVHLVAEYTKDFSPLRNLPAFQKLEEEIKDVLNKYYPS